MAVTFFIVPDFETSYSGFIFGIISGRIIIAYDRLIKKCGNQLHQIGGKIIHFFTKLLIFFFVFHILTTLPIFRLYATMLCNSLGICHILPSMWWFCSRRAIQEQHLSAIRFKKYQKYWLRRTLAQWWFHWIFMSLRFIVETSFVEHNDLPNYYDFKTNIEIIC